MTRSAGPWTSAVYRPPIAPDSGMTSAWTASPRSENRAGSVRDFLVQEGIVTSSISSRGFGKGQPVATNDTAAGRQQNRRVELIVSGDVIGTKAN